MSRRTIEQFAQKISQAQGKLAERAKKLATLETLLRDPDLAEFIPDLTKNGKNGHSDRKKTRGPEPPLSTSNRMVPNATGLRSAILNLVPDFKAPFTITDVVKALQVRQFNFDGRKPDQAVRDSLYVLAKRKREIRLAIAGQGGKPNYYETL